MTTVGSRRNPNCQLSRSAALDSAAATRQGRTRQDHAEKRRASASRATRHRRAAGLGFTFGLAFASTARALTRRRALHLRAPMGFQPGVHRSDAVLQVAAV